MKEKNFPQTRISPQKKIARMFLGLCLSLALLEAGFRLGGFVQSSLREYGNLQSVKQKGAYRILCLGDSMTQMQYPLLLDQILNERNIGVRFSVIDPRSEGPSPTAVILSRVESYLTEYRPDTVIAMMGNDDKHSGHLQDISKDDKSIFRHFLLYQFVRMRFTHILEKIKLENIFELSGSHPGRNAKPENARTVPEKEHPSNEISEEKAARSDLRGAEGTRGPISSYLNDGRISKTENSLKKTIELDPENKEAYAELEKLYRLRGEVFRAEDFFKNAVAIDPKNANAYIGLGYIYRGRGELSQAEESFKKAIEIYPRNDKAYAGLGKLYEKWGMLSQAVDALKKALELNPVNEVALVELGSLYRDQGELAQAEDLCKRAIEHNPRKFSALCLLAMLYRDQGKLSQAEDSFRKALDFNPEKVSERTLRAMASLYTEMDKPELAKEYTEKAYQLGFGNISAETVKNYRKLKEILDQKGIKLVCMQYPMRNVDPLKKIFEKDKGVIFVDNESLFKEAVKKDGHKEYFNDTFGGDFGHCTPKGNMLLAQNIADVILREVFHKR
jgi:Tfp pilus assembly protein PilF